MSEITERDIADFYGSRDWDHARAAALVNFGNTCRDCDMTEGPFDVDHIVPVRQAWGARLAMTNLQVLCRACHLRKHRGALPGKNAEVGATAEFGGRI